MRESERERQRQGRITKRRNEGKADEEAAEDEVGAGEAEENVEEVDSEDGESDIETSISKYSKSGVAQKRKTTSSEIQQLYEEMNDAMDKEIREETDEEKEEKESDDEKIAEEENSKTGMKSHETNGDQCNVVVYDRGKLKDHIRSIHEKGHGDVKVK